MGHCHMTLEMRERLESYWRWGLSQSEMADMLGVHRSTISRELKRNGSQWRYDADFAHDMAMYRKKRRKGHLYYNRKRALRPPYIFDLSHAGQERKFPFEKKHLSWLFRRKRKKLKRQFYIPREPLDLYKKWDRAYQLSLRKRDHVLENCARGKRNWRRVVRWRGNEMLKFYHYPDRERWRGEPNLLILLGILPKQKKYRPRRLGFYKVLKKLKPLREQMNVRIERTEFELDYKPVIFFPKKKNSTAMPQCVKSTVPAAKILKICN
jgi:predicted DNA-binding protein YlxM (UPF0122 family)